MFRHKRWFAGPMVLMMVATLLAACGGDTAPVTSDTNSAATNSSSADTNSAATNTNSADTNSAPAPAAGNVKELTIMWAEWPPADYLLQLGQDYEAETGIKVNVLTEPWPTFANRVFGEFSAKGTAFDLVVGDSQWLGQGAEQGHYVELTDVFDSELNGKALAPATVESYAAYPKGSGKLWAYPTEGDAPGWAYRKDLFEDPAEKDAFQAKYGYELAPPKTWKELIDIAEFFTRPDKNLYGAAVYTELPGDAITMGYENMLFSYGADWGDQKTYKVDGVLNSPEGVKALEDYKKLYSLAPPGSGNIFFTGVNDYFTGGQVAMGMNFFAFLPGLLDANTNPYADKTGFFPMPEGPGGHYAALGGQGMSIVNYISDERKAAAMDFLKWFGKTETQKRWAELGGYTCNAEVLKSDEFLNATPYNKAFADTMQIVKDFWAVPVYAPMLDASQRELHNYIVGDQGTAQETLDKLTAEHEKTLKDAGFLK